MIHLFQCLGSDMLSTNVLRLVSRDEWLAQPPNNDLTPLNLPVGRIIITHTATEPCETQVCNIMLLKRFSFSITFDPFLGCLYA
jgi:hypothetical protein